MDRSRDWIDVCALEDILPDTGVCALLGKKQVAIFRVGKASDLYALSNFDPFSKAFVLSRGIVGDKGGVPKVASPIYKQGFDLRTGQCLDDPAVKVRSYPVRLRAGRVEVQFEDGAKQEAARAPAPVRQQRIVLAANTLAFAACFAAWTLNGVLTTFLVQRGIFAWSRVEISWLVGLPILTGSLLRLPVGLLADRLGGRLAHLVVLIAAALGCLALAAAQSLAGFVLGSLLLGLAGTSFAAGVAHTAACFPRERQGTALGVFGAGTLGAALTGLLAPSLLDVATSGGAFADGWRALPRAYAAALLATAALFYLSTPARRAEGGARSLRAALAVIGGQRVWRFGLYYLLLFGGFVALGQWLVPTYVNQYGTSLSTAGMLVAAFVIPGSFARVLGGYLADRMGPRTVLLGALGTCTLVFFLLAVPQRGSVALCVGLTVVLGLALGVGMGVVMKLVAKHFPSEVGLVGGLVGLVGGLGGFLLPVLFGYLVALTEVWATCFTVLGVLSVASLLWMHVAVVRAERDLRLRLGARDLSLPGAPS